MKRFCQYFVGGKLVLLFASIVGIVVAIGLLPATGETADVVTLRMSHDTANTGVKNRASLEAVERVSKRSNGRVRIEVYDRAQLVKGTEEAQAIRQGQIDMSATPVPQMPGASKNLAAFLLPMWAAASEERRAKVFDESQAWSSIKEDIETNLQVKVFGVGSSPPMSYFFAKKRVTKLEDFRGLKMRVPGMGWDRYVMALGGVPIQMNLGEVYTSLDNGTIDGVDTSPDALVTFRGELVVKYGLLTQDAYVPYVFMISKRAWSRISPEDQKIVQEEFIRAVKRCREIAKTGNEAPLKRAKETGVQIDDNPATIRPFIDRLVAAQDEMVQYFNLDPKLVSQIRSALQ